MFVKAPFVTYTGLILINALLLAAVNGYITHLPHLMVPLLMFLMLLTTAGFSLTFIKRMYIAFVVIVATGIANIALCVLQVSNDTEIAFLLEALLLALAIIDTYTRDKKEDDAPHLEMLKLQQDENNALSQKIDAYKAQLNQALVDLQQTQRQLIQKEKLASLGELTSNIAVEIQDPLNFVNNFTEMSEELINKLECEAQQLLIEQLKNNFHKISHHGKRADAILKGMLSHSRINKGEKRLISVNALMEESLQHLKSKHPDVRLHKEFDHSIPQFECNPQELNSVLGHLYANALYAIQQKKQLAGGDPELTVTTRNTSQWIEIIVHDTGTGIDPLSLKKVFQPFYSTKPGLQGTGLGLSLSHAIIVKGLDGELTVRSEEHVFTEFIIRLPIS